MGISSEVQPEVDLDNNRENTSFTMCMYQRGWEGGQEGQGSRFTKRRPRADVNCDCWIQSPECWSLHHEAKRAPEIRRPTHLGALGKRILMPSYGPEMCLMAARPLCMAIRSGRGERERERAIPQFHCKYLHLWPNVYDVSLTRRKLSVQFWPWCMASIQYGAMLWGRGGELTSDIWEMSRPSGC